MKDIKTINKLSYFVFVECFFTKLNMIFRLISINGEISIQTFKRFIFKIPKLYFVSSNVILPFPLLYSIISIHDTNIHSSFVL